MASTSITAIVMPSIIHVSNLLSLYDNADQDRKTHKAKISRLGGIGVFLGFFIGAILCNIILPNKILNFLFLAAILVLSLGLKDDLSGVNAKTKFIIQFIVAIILVEYGGLRISSHFLYQHDYQIPYLLSSSVSVIFIVLIVNTFNLIDGIDGLLGATGCVINLIFALFFGCVHNYQLAGVCMAMAGALSGFLPFNMINAKIFIGDAGAMLVGLVISFEAIEFINYSETLGVNLQGRYVNPYFILIVLGGPIFDTLRVFLIRIVKLGSPFKADNNHMHHRLLTLGLTHFQTTSILVFINLLSIITFFLFQFADGVITIALYFGLLILCNCGLSALLYINQISVQSKRLMNSKPHS
ncbi:MAG: MraY family glycosyltransferase [Bacteroidia bacterium]